MMTWAHGPWVLGVSAGVSASVVKIILALCASNLNVHLKIII